MASDQSNVRRILQIKIRMPTADVSQFLPFMKASTAFYEAFGPARFRFLRNVDDPTQFFVEIEYETPQALELNRHKVASDPMVRSIVQGWRAMTAGAVEIDVYEDVTTAT